MKTKQLREFGAEGRLRALRREVLKRIESFHQDAHSWPQDGQGATIGGWEGLEVIAPDRMP